MLLSSPWNRAECICVRDGLDAGLAQEAGGTEEAWPGPLVGP